MGRRLLNLVTALSLLLGAAAVALWARSYGVRDMIGLTLGAQSVWATSRDGTMEVELLSWQSWEGYAWRRFSYPAAPPSTRGRRGAGGATGPSAFAFDAYRGTTGRGTPRRGAVFPHWAMLLPAAVLPAARLVLRRRRHRRKRRGLCPACGYDLRATPGRCPECGEGGMMIG